MMIALCRNFILALINQMKFHEAEFTRLRNFSQQKPYEFHCHDAEIKFFFSCYCANNF